MTRMPLVGALLGLLTGLGLWLAFVRLPWLRRPTLDDRLDPYLRDLPAAWASSDPAPVVRLGPLQPVERLLAPVLVDLAHRIDAALGGTDDVRRRLDRLDTGLTVERFRVEQALGGLVGGFGGLALGVGGGVVGDGVAAVPVVATGVVGALLGVLGRDHLLSVAVRRREQRMLAEFPTVAELLALAVGAGEGITGAIERVTRTCHGELPAELRRTLAEARAGGGLVEALDALGRRTGLPELSRFVDGLAVAVDRGTPLADVLRAQAHDVREHARRRLLEAGGRAEIAMMVPVVFLVLPVTVVFALFPGLAALDLQP